jgi:hypothetical protein
VRQAGPVANRHARHWVLKAPVFDQAPKRIDVLAATLTREALTLAKLILAVAMHEDAVAAVGVRSVLGDRRRIAVQQERPAVDAGGDFLDLVQVAAPPIALAVGPIGIQDQYGLRAAFGLQGRHDLFLDRLAVLNSIGVDDAGGRNRIGRTGHDLDLRHELGFGRLLQQQGPATTDRNGQRQDGRLIRRPPARTKDCNGIGSTRTSPAGWHV